MLRVSALEFPFGRTEIHHAGLGVGGCGYGDLVNHALRQTLAIKWALVFSPTVASGVFTGFLVSSDFPVVRFQDRLHIGHATVGDLKGVFVKDLVKNVIRREMFADQVSENPAKFGFDRFTERRVIVKYVSPTLSFSVRWYLISQICGVVSARLQLVDILSRMVVENFFVLRKPANTFDHHIRDGFCDTSWVVG